jgi:4,5:9,10-diseco-3-hydroxy-5,9,17-trioxoandrosta-1(10),2-diene-4-oate hydrolase
VTRRAAGCAGCAAVPAAGVAALALLVLLDLPERLPPERPWISEAGYSVGDLDAGGGRIRYLRTGAGPPVVLLHGFAASIYTWKDVIPALAASHEVVALDFPGFGDSSIPRPLDVAAYPGHVLAVMDRLGIGRASLVGNSLGGLVAIELAAEHPARVERLVLLDSAGFNLAPEDRPRLLRIVGSPAVAPLLARLPVRRRLVAFGLRQVFHDDGLVTDERIDAYARPMMRPGAIAATAELLAGRVPGSIEDRLARVRAPVLILWGREDRWIPMAHARRFADLLPGARLAILDGCGHVPQEEKPAEVARRIAEFIRPGAD